MKKIFYLILLTFLCVKCEQWDLEEIIFLEFTTSPITNININQVVAESEVKGIESSVLIQHGHVWSSTNNQPTIQSNDGVDSKGGKDVDGLFSSQIKNLEVNTIYYLRPFAQTDNQISYGDAVMFTTRNVMVVTDSIEYLGAREAKLYGNFCCVEIDLTIDQHGFCWSSANSSPTIENDHFINLGTPDSNGSFSAMIGELQDSTVFYYRSYAVTDFGSTVNYGEVKSWDTRLENIWEPKADFPANSFNFRGFTYNDKGYVYGANEIYEYNPSSDTWSLFSIKPGDGLVEPLAYVVGDDIYFLVGSFEYFVPNNMCWRFNMVTKTWEQLNDFPGAPRISMVGFVAGNGKCYLGAGWDPDNGLYFNDFWEYDPTMDTWDRIDNYPGESDGVLMFSFVKDGKGYVGGGVFSGLENLFSYNIQSQSWEKKNFFPGGLAIASTSFVIDGTVYVGTGETEGTAASKSFWKYDHIADSWSKITDVGGKSRASAFSFAIGDRGYVGGGSDGGGREFLDFWMYKPIQE